MRQRAGLGGRGGGGGQSQMLPPLWSGVHRGQSNALEYLWHSGVRERHLALPWRACPSIASPFLLQEECQNYVRVLIVTGRKVFMCGTNAFSPVCSSRQVGAAWGRADRGGHQEVLSLRHTASDGASSSAHKPKQKGCPIRFEFQIKNRQYFSINMSHARFRIYLR